MIKEFRVVYAGMRSVIGEPKGYIERRKEYEDGKVFDEVDLTIAYKFAPV
jgi:hypothetical protein